MLGPQPEHPASQGLSPQTLGRTHSSAASPNLAPWREKASFGDDCGTKTRVRYSVIISEESRLLSTHSSPSPLNVPGPYMGAEGGRARPRPLAPGTRRVLLPWGTCPVWSRSSWCLQGGQLVPERLGQGPWGCVTIPAGVPASGPTACTCGGLGGQSRFLPSRGVHKEQACPARAWTPTGVPTGQTDRVADVAWTIQTSQHQSDGGRRYGSPAGLRPGAFPSSPCVQLSPEGVPWAGKWPRAAAGGRRRAGPSSPWE